MHGAEGTGEVRVPPAITPESAAQFARDFDQAALDPATRVIVLTGETGLFCRGMRPSGPSSVELREHLNDFAECLLRMRFAQKPVIAAVDGIAIGGGLGLAATADMVIASSRSTFGLPEALFGFVPAIILPLLLERMRPADCRIWMLSGYSRPATEAREARLVDAVCEPEELARQVSRAARGFSRAGAVAVGRVKSMTARQGLEQAVRDGIRATAAMLGEPGVSERFLRFFADGAMPWEES